MVGDNIHVLNPGSVTANVTVRLSGASPINFSLVAGAESYATFPTGTIGGPVTVTSDQPVLASQRVQYYQTFNEVVARSAAQASSTSYFNWFDKASAGMAGDNVHLLNTRGTTAHITVGLPGTAPVTLTLPSLAETYVTSAPATSADPSRSPRISRSCPRNACSTTRASTRPRPRPPRRPRPRATSSGSTRRPRGWSVTTSTSSTPAALLPTSRSAWPAPHLSRSAWRRGRRTTFRFRPAASAGRSPSPRTNRWSPRRGFSTSRPSTRCPRPDRYGTPTAATSATCGHGTERAGRDRPNCSLIFFRGLPGEVPGQAAGTHPNYLAMSKYAEQSVVLEDRNSSTAMIVGLVPMSARVLDVGCSTGYLGEALKRERLARVWGIELDESDAEKARQRGFEQVITADLDTFAWEALDAYEFDVVVFADVLEHLKRPGDAIRGAMRRLTPEGHVTASIPNIAHLSIRVELMEGGFAYENLGLLDDTHLKYFTKKTIEDMFQATGLSI